MAVQFLFDEMSKVDTEHFFFPDSSASTADNNA
jgi:hypothetical protein